MGPSSGLLKVYVRGEPGRVGGPGYIAVHALERLRRPQSLVARVRELGGGHPVHGLHAGHMTARIAHFGAELCLGPAAKQPPRAQFLGESGDGRTSPLLIFHDHLRKTAQDCSGKSLNCSVMLGHGLPFTP